MAPLSLTTIPAEIRNSIYKLLGVQDNPIVINSQRTKGTVRVRNENQAEFAGLLRVNKQINTEAKTIFYGYNTFIIGNGFYGSTSCANLHGFRQFTSRVPKHCLSQIRQVEIELSCSMDYRYGGRLGYWLSTVESKSLQSLICSLMKYFTNIERIMFIMTEMRHCWESRLLTQNERKLNAPLLQGCHVRTAKTIQPLFSLPELQVVYFKGESCPNMAELYAAVLQGMSMEKEEKAICA